MKAAIAAMIAAFFLVVWPCGGLWSLLLQPLIGGGAEQTFLYPVYAGIVLLAGLIAGCTQAILQAVRSCRNAPKKD